MLEIVLALVCLALIDNITIAHQYQSVKSGEYLGRWLMNSRYYCHPVLLCLFLQELNNV